jgi:hypothetical protein
MASSHILENVSFSNHLRVWLVIKTLLIKTAISAKRRMCEVTCYFSGVSMWNQLKWLHYALHQTFYILLSARSYAWRRIPERTASDLIATFPVAQIVSTLVAGYSHLLPSVEQQIISENGLWKFFLLTFSSIVFFLSRVIAYVYCLVCSFAVMIGCLEFNFPHGFPSDHILITSTGITIFQSSVSIL